MNIKRWIYGLPLARGYRNYRTRVLAARHRAHFLGFLFAGTDAFFDPAWEAEEREAMETQLGRADVLIDIGANQGLYSCIAAQRGVHVAAVEPEIGNLRFLMSNIRANGFEVEIFATALGASTATSDFYGDGDTASLVRGWGSSPTSFVQRVPVNTADNLFADRWPGQRILIKMDVEGFEAAVLDGAARLLARTPRPVWLIETFPTVYDEKRSPNPDFARVFETMLAHGYQCTHVQSRLSVDYDQVKRWQVGEGIVSPLGGNFLFSTGL